MSLNEFGIWFAFIGAAVILALGLLVELLVYLERRNGW